MLRIAVGTATGTSAGASAVVPVLTAAVISVVVVVLGPGPYKSSMSVSVSDNLLSILRSQAACTWDRVAAGLALASEAVAAAAGRFTSVSGKSKEKGLLLASSLLLMDLGGATMTDDGDGKGGGAAAAVLVPVAVVVGIAALLLPLSFKAAVCCVSLRLACTVDSEGTTDGASVLEAVPEVVPVVACCLPIDAIPVALGSEYSINS